MVSAVRDATGDNVPSAVTVVGHGIVVFFDPEVQRAWHMLILSPICYR